MATWKVSSNAPNVTFGMKTPVITLLVGVLVIYVCLLGLANYFKEPGVYVSGCVDPTFPQQAKATELVPMCLPKEQHITDSRNQREDTDNSGNHGKAASQKRTNEDKSPSNLKEISNDKGTSSDDNDVKVTNSQAKNETKKNVNSLSNLANETDNKEHATPTNETNPKNCQPLRFADARNPFPLTALSSYPGSGNTWIRHLIQQATGQSAVYS